MAVVSGTSATVMRGPSIPGQHTTVVPVLQAQDGSFVGTFYYDGGTNPNMVSFDVSGNTRWVVPLGSDDYPQIATADGGVITQSGIVYDQDGRATGMVGTTTQSWTGNEYLTSGAVSQVALAPYFLGVSFWAQAGGMFSPGTALIPIASVSTYAVNGNAFGSDALPPLHGDSVRPHDANASANGILSHAEWNKFKQSNCAAVFALGIPPIWHGSPPDFYDPTLQGVQKRQGQLNFYDTGNPYVANLKLSEVTGGLLHNPVGLYDYLANLKADAATPQPNMPQFRSSTRNNAPSVAGSNPRSTSIRRPPAPTPRRSRPPPHT